MISGETNPSLAIPKAAPYIFDFTYPFYDESKRAKFQEDFLRHFYFREIGQETYARFSLQLQDKFVTKMEKYNKLFKANEQEFDIFENDAVEETTTREHNDNRNNTDNTETANTGKNSQTTSQTAKTSESGESSQNENRQESDLPQGNLAAFNDNSYLSNASKSSLESTNSRSGQNTSDGSVTGSTQDTGTVKATRNEETSGNESGRRIVKGTHGNRAEMLDVYNKTVANIKEMFYDDCEDLFMLIWAPNPDMFNPIWG